MKPITKTVGSLLLLMVVGIAWWLLSPLFISETVEDDFPLVSDSHEELTEGEYAEMLEMSTAAGVPLPLYEEVKVLSEEDLAAIELEIMQNSDPMPDATQEDAMPEVSGPTLLAQGTFEGADQFHQGSGFAKIYELEDGSRILRLEEFDVTNGPDLRVYITPEGSPSRHADVVAGVELAALKGNKGNQNYDIPEGVEDLGSVVIYCKPFRVIFATANLTQ